MQQIAKTTYYYDSSNRLIKSNDGMTYFYDHTGVAGFKYNGARYVYQKDALRNIVAILDNTGATVVQYVYDAWGNHKAYDANNKLLSSSGSKKYATAPTQLCDINPFKYRGYFYDYETGLYYLKTRYYDPEIGRFINMDNFRFADPQAINGLNLYAYCSNNPVAGYDPEGLVDWGKVRDWFSTITGLFNSIGATMSAGALLAAVVQGRWDEIVEDATNGCFNPFNQDESVALNSNVFSFYKGEFVIRHSIPDTTSCQIFGTIFLNTSEINDAYGINTLRHEYGHGIQERLIGLAYLVRIAIPSLATYFSGLKGAAYYSMPWERTADYFGGVTRSFTYKDHSLEWSFAELVGGPIVIPFYFMFGF